MVRPARARWHHRPMGPMTRSMVTRGMYVSMATRWPYGSDTAEMATEVTAPRSAERASAVAVSR